MSDFILSGEMVSERAAEHFSGWTGGTPRRTEFGSWIVPAETDPPAEALAWCSSARVDVNRFERLFPRSLVFDTGIVLSCFDDDFGLWNMMGVTAVTRDLKDVAAYGELEILDNPEKGAGKLGLLPMKKNHCPDPGRCVLITSHRFDGAAGFERVFLFSKSLAVDNGVAAGPLLVFRHSSIGVTREFIR